MNADLSLWGVDIFAAGLIFARLGAMIMLLPGFGETAIPARVRLGFALALAVLLAPLLAPLLPGRPETLAGALTLLIGEIGVGLMIGAAGRMILSALATAGQIVGLETGLAFAQTTDPTQGQAGALIAVFLGLFGVTLIFATGVHHELLRALVNSYRAFAPGVFPALGDVAQYGLRAFADAFRIGVQIAAPLMLAGIVFRLGLGVLSKLIPQIQVFFVAMPINVLGGFAVLTLGLSAGMLVWLDRLDEFAKTLR